MVEKLRNNKLNNLNNSKAKPKHLKNKKEMVDSKSSHNKIRIIKHQKGYHQNSKSKNNKNQYNTHFSKTQIISIVNRFRNIRI